MKVAITVIRKEIRHHLVSSQFLVITVLTVVLATLATLAGTADYNLRAERYLNHLEQNQLALQQVHVYSFLQPVATRPPEPLSILARGFEGHLGDEARISVFSIPAKATGNRRGSTFPVSFQDFDLTTIVRVVLGLQALLLTFDAFVGEKEKRTLELVMANHVSRTALAAGKYLGALAVSLTALGLSGLVSLAIVLQGGVRLAAQQELRLAAVFVTYGGYLSLMILVGLAISLVAKSAAQSLAYAILIWLLLVFLIPPSAITVARELAGENGDPRQVEGAVARLEQERQQQFDRARAQDPLRDGRTAHRAPFLLSDRDRRSVLHRYGSARYYESLAAYHSYETALGIRYAERIFEIRRGYELELRSAERLSGLLASVSPAFLLERLAESFAATSIADHDDFLDACRAYRRELIAYLEHKEAFSTWRWFTDDPPETRPWTTTFLGIAPEDVEAADIGELASRLRSPEIQQRLQAELEEFRTRPDRLLDLDDLPQFRRHGRELGHPARRVAREIALLLGLQGLLAGVIFLRFRGYEIRAAQRHWSAP